MYHSYQVWEALEMMVFLTELVEKDFEKLVEAFPGQEDKYSDVEDFVKFRFFRLLCRLPVFKAAQKSMRKPKRTLYT